jgi:hypothetical protein
MCCTQYAGITGNQASVIAADGIEQQVFEPEALMTVEQPRHADAFVRDYLRYLLGQRS